jgi:hypothetical protein
MAHDLDQLKEELYEAFNRAMKGVREFSFLNESRVGTLSQAVTAAADAANAIVNVEKQIAERDGGKPGLKLPKG